MAALGRAIYKKPGLVSEQSLTGFIRHPRRPDLRSYWLFRQYLMETSQIAGSFYGEAGRKRLMETLPARMLDPVDAYDRISERRADPAEVESATKPVLRIAR